MSTTPVSLDFSKAVPINQAQPQSSPQPASNGVTLDFSKAVPVGGQSQLDLSNPNGQGTYQMSLNGNTVAVPYGQVSRASDLGYQFANDQDRARYTKDSGMTLSNNPVTGVLSGIGGGVLDTAYDLGSAIVDPISGAAGRLTGDKVGDSSLSLNPLDGLAKPTPDALQNNTTSEKVGGGLESIAEFILGDEALKGMSLSEKLGLAQKASALAEKSPYIGKLLNLGMDAVRQGSVGAAQGLAKSGSVTDAGKEGAATAGVSALAGAAGVAMNKAASPLVDWLAGKGHSLTDTVDSAKLINGIEDAFNAERARPPVIDVPRPNMDRQTLADFIKTQVDEAEHRMHTDYQEGLDNFTGATGGKAVPLAGSPLQSAAAGWLADSSAGGSGVSSLDGAVNGIVPGSKRIRPLLTQLADPKSNINLDADQLVTLRQNLGKQFRRLAWNDPNKDVIRSLFDGIDETLDQIGGDNKSYQTLRQNYRTTLGNLSDPFIKKIQRGTVPDMTKALTSGAGSKTKAEALQRVIGNGNWVQQVIGQNLFLHAVQDATSEDGIVDIRKLARNWKNIPDSTKSAIYGPTPEGQELKDALDNVVSQAAKRGNHVKLAKNLVRAAGLIGAGYGVHKDNPTGALLGVAAALTGGGELSRVAVDGLSNPTSMRVLGKTLSGTAGAADAVMSAAANPRTRQVLTGAAGLLSGSKSKKDPSGSYR